MCLRERKRERERSDATTRDDDEKRKNTRKRETPPPLFTRSAFVVIIHGRRSSTDRCIVVHVSIPIRLSHTRLLNLKSTLNQLSLRELRWNDLGHNRRLRRTFHVFRRLKVHRVPSSSLRRKRERERERESFDRERERERERDRDPSKTKAGEEKTKNAMMIRFDDDEKKSTRGVPWTNAVPSKHP